MTGMDGGKFAELAAKIIRDITERPVDYEKLAAHLEKQLQRPVKVYYTIAELRDCTGACHIFADNTQRAILTRRSGVHQAIGGGW